MTAARGREATPCLFTAKRRPQRADRTRRRACSRPSDDRSARTGPDAVLALGQATTGARDRCHGDQSACVVGARWDDFSAARQRRPPPPLGSRVRPDNFSHPISHRTPRYRVGNDRIGLLVTWQKRLNFRMKRDCKIQDKMGRNGLGNRCAHASGWPGDRRRRRMAA
jgi:hypothetical protein